MKIDTVIFRILKYLYETSDEHIEYVRRFFMKQTNTDTKHTQDDYFDIGFDEPLSYERFHQLIEHARQKSNRKKDDEQ